ncbi:class III extradiol dioxygenase family protein [Emcibacter nanhaiensis]|uniref:Protocatechuate 3,4-dioxygenase n=1 Tax=Emcibacter nanhaiensis TaxID=1505037 RepID=A0A501PAR2_9PROT|nr:class III extradiol dioxygenase family protein [Emcibacter nanhaiensis]TPD57450.1 protocatechuate 3,4-dioxygenase [Emcibacter nanhaiensis]
MAKIVGGITTSHIPAIGKAIAEKDFESHYWKAFFDSYPPVREWLDEVKPDVAVVIYNDHGLNFFLNAMPTFAIGAAQEYRNEDEGWGIPEIPPFPGDPKLSWHIIESLMAEEFDLTTCQEMKVDHGFTVPMQLMWPERRSPEVRTIPVCVNTVQHPVPSPKRCYDMGKAMGRAIRSYGEDVKVVIIGTGGLSHQLEGERAGFLNQEFDEYCMEKIVEDPVALLDYSIPDLVRLAGSQGVELVLWLMMRGALSDKVNLLHKKYTIPISNTAAGLLLLENLD